MPWLIHTLCNPHLILVWIISVTPESSFTPLPWQLPFSTPRGNQHSDFSHHTLFVPVLELHVREITQYCVWNFFRSIISSLILNSFPDTCLLGRSMLAFLHTRGPNLTYSLTLAFSTKGRKNLDSSQELSFLCCRATPQHWCSIHHLYNATVDGYLGYFNFPSCKQHLSVHLWADTFVPLCVGVSEVDSSK